MWLSVKSLLPVQRQPLHEEGRLCRPERVGLRGESPPLEAGIPAQALGATELCALGNTPRHTHAHLTHTPCTQTDPTTTLRCEDRVFLEITETNEAP